MQSENGVDCTLPRHPDAGSSFTAACGHGNVTTSRECRTCGEDLSLYLRREDGLYEPRAADCPLRRARLCLANAHPAFNAALLAEARHTRRTFRVNGSDYDDDDDDAATGVIQIDAYREKDRDGNVWHSYGAYRRCFQL